MRKCVHVCGRVGVFLRACLCVRQFVWACVRVFNCVCVLSCVCYCVCVYMCASISVDLCDNG